MLLAIGAVLQDGPGAITHDYRVFLGSFRILPTAILERGVAIVALVLVLAIATYGARRLLGRAAHADDYADALDASRRNLQDATRAKEKAEAALAALDRREAELTEQNQRFNAALGNMPMGLCMFDQDQRLLVCNDRYIDMYGLSHELAKPGTTFRQIIEARIANGLYSGRPEQYLDERLGAAFEMEANTKVQELSDGRTIAVMHEPMPQGGWVATHEDITQLRRIEQQMSHMSRHDALTDLPNRVLLRERIEEALERAAEGGLPLIVLLFDIDRFKEVNDTLGPSIGDALLQGVAQRLSRRLKRVEMIARVGGDEFVVLQLAEKPATAAAVLAKKVQAALGTSSTSTTTRSWSPRRSASPSGRATAACRRAAQECRPGAQPRQERRPRHHSLFRARHGSAHAGAPPPRARPAVGAAQRRVRALLPAAAQHRARRDHRLRGAAALEPPRARPRRPGRLHPAGRGDRPHRADRRVGAAASVPRCREMAEGVKVAVNLSAAQFRFGNVRQAVISALGGSHLLPQSLELEVTETVLLQDSDVRGGDARQAARDRRRHRARRFRHRLFVAELLEPLPLRQDQDRAGLHQGDPPKSRTARSRSCARSLRIGASLGIATTAEGVETLEEFERVRREGCTEVQGYFISRPRPVGEVRDMLARQQAVPGGRSPVRARLTQAQRASGE